MSVYHLTIAILKIPSYKEKHTEIKIIQTCYHQNKVEVESSVTGEVLALLCLDCDKQLPVNSRIEARGGGFGSGSTSTIFHSKYGITEYWPETRSHFHAPTYREQEAICEEACICSTCIKFRIYRDLFRPD
jgi:hypothetical protein